MSALAHHEILYFLLGVSILLGLARLFGEVAKALRQPSVVGEILAGILLGPTVLGALVPDLQQHLFPVGAGGQAAALEGLTTIAVVLFLLIAGMEVDLSIVWRQGRAALSVGLVGMAIPFLFGLAAASVFPGFLGLEEGTRPLVFTLFVATALSISALPVVAKILLDLNIFRSDLGMVMVAAAIVNDLLGWMVFAVILAMMGTVKVVALPIPVVIVMTLAFAFFMLVVMRWVIDKALPYLYAYASWPGGVMSFICSGAFFFAAVTEWIGVHAIFGAFLFGCALGDSRHLRERTRTTLENFVSFIFVPLFFASIGLKVNFLAAFDIWLVLVVCAIATVSKVLGSALGAHLSGMSRRESWAMGFGLNARGAMEIILGLLALEAGVIGERLFVALVTMALLTSMTSGTLMEKALQRRRPVTLVDRLAGRHFLPSMKAATRDEAIHELAASVASSTDKHAADIAAAVLAREALMSTGIGHGIAVPHARIPGLKAPVVALGRSRHGVDFDAPDGREARLVFLILTSSDSYSDQLEILSDISRTFQKAETVEKALHASTYAELLALLKVERNGEAQGAHPA